MALKFSFIVVGLCGRRRLAGDLLYLLQFGLPRTLLTFHHSHSYLDFLHFSGIHHPYDFAARLLVAELYANDVSWP